MRKSRDMYWKCPECDAVAWIDETLDYGDYQDCQECDEVVQPHRHSATHEEFWAYCRSLKE